MKSRHHIGSLFRPLCQTDVGAALAFQWPQFRREMTTRQPHGSMTRGFRINEGVSSALFADVVSVVRSMERTPSDVSMPSERRHDAHNADIMQMSGKYSFISQDGCLIADLPFLADPNRNTCKRRREQECEVRTDSLQRPNHNTSEALFLETS